METQRIILLKINCKKIECRAGSIAAPTRGMTRANGVGVALLIAPEVHEMSRQNLNRQSPILLNCRSRGTQKINFHRFYRLVFANNQVRKKYQKNVTNIWKRTVLI